MLHYDVDSGCRLLLGILAFASACGEGVITDNPGAARVGPSEGGVPGDDTCDSGPATCSSLGNYECGTWDDTCGGVVSCGSCGAGEVCRSGACTPSGGKPDPSNTGPTDESALVPWPYGSYTITSPGVYENFVATDQIDVEADNVTFRNFTSDTNANYNIRIDSSVRGTLVEDGEMVNSTCVMDYGTDTVIRRIHCHEATIDGIKLHGVNVLLEDSLIEKVGIAYTGSEHVDLIQMINSRGATIRYNTIEGEECDSSSYKVSTGIQIANSMTTCPVIDGNWITGVDSYLLNGADNCTTVVKNNRFGTYFQYGLWGSGNFADQGGNVWDCDGSPVSGNTGGPLPSCGIPWPQDFCQ